MPTMQPIMAVATMTGHQLQLVIADTHPTFTFFGHSYVVQDFNADSDN
jgi:hypothetical protein